MRSAAGTPSQRPPRASAAGEQRLELLPLRAPVLADRLGHRARRRLPGEGGVHAFEGLGGGGALRQPVVNTVKMTRCCCRQRQHSANTTHGTTSALSSALHSNTANTTRKHTAHTHHTRITQASAPGCRPPRAARRPRASARPSALRRPTAGARCRPAAACRGRGGSRPGRAAGSAGLFIGVCWRRYVSSDMEEELAASKAAFRNKAARGGAARQCATLCAHPPGTCCCR